MRELTVLGHGRKQKKNGCGMFLWSLREKMSTYFISTFNTFQWRVQSTGNASRDDFSSLGWGYWSQTSDLLNFYPFDLHHSAPLNTSHKYLGVRTLKLKLKTIQNESRNGVGALKGDLRTMHNIAHHQIFSDSYWFKLITWRDAVRPRRDIREFKIYDETVAKTSLKIASSSFSIYFAIVSVCLTFES